MKLTNREKVLLPVALIAIVVALFLNFITLPLYKEIDNLELQAKDYTSQILDAEVKQGEIEKLEQQILLAQEDFDTKYKDILQVWDQPELLTFIENTIDPLCEKTSIDFFDVVSADAIQAGDINIVLKTNYNNLQTIWRKLEEAKYFNTITLFDVSEPAEIDSDISFNKKFEVSMNIRFYSRNLIKGYPKEYDFMKGNYGKANIFQ